MLINNRAVTVDALFIVRAQRQDNCSSVLASFNTKSNRQAKEINNTKRHVLDPHAVQPQEGKASCVVYIVFPIFLLALTLFETI